MKLINLMLTAALVAPIIALGFWCSTALAGENLSGQPAVQSGWLTSMEEAKNIARKEGKDILVDFTGTDWCVWCIKLDEEVFSTKAWAAGGAKQFVMLQLDFPRNKELAKGQKEHNQKLKEEFEVQGFPTIFLLDADGAPYAKTGYQPGGPVKYLEHLNGLSRQKDEKNALARQIAEAPAKDKPALLNQLIGKLNEWEIGFWYPGFKEEAANLDEDNKQGFRLKYALELVYFYHGKQNKQKQDYYFEIVKKLSPAKTGEIELDFKIEEIQSKYYGKKDWKGALVEFESLAKADYKGEAGQKLYYQIALAHNGLKDQKQARENLQKARDFAPDSELGREIKQILEKMKVK